MNLNETALGQLQTHYLSKMPLKEYHNIGGNLPFDTPFVYIVHCASRRTELEAWIDSTPYVKSRVLVASGYLGKELASIGGDPVIVIEPKALLVMFSEIVRLCSTETQQS